MLDLPVLAVFFSTNLSTSGAVHAYSAKYSIVLRVCRQHSPDKFDAQLTVGFKVFQEKYTSRSDLIFDLISTTGARPIIRKPENKKLLTLLGSFPLTSSILTAG
jgi:hypothetical protein